MIFAEALNTFFEYLPAGVLLVTVVYLWKKLPPNGDIEKCSRTLTSLDQKGPP